MKKKRILQIVFSIVIFYFLLTLLLFAVETLPKGGQGSSIESLGDAAWYLLATLTTVGYGDITPVTMAGKIIGGVMMISSAGVLTFVLGLLFSLLFGRLLPSVCLWSFRNHNWYVFSTLDERTQLLASRLAKEDPSAAYIFCGSDETISQEYFPTMHRHVIVDDPLEVVVQKQNREKDCHVFFMTDNAWENYNLGSGVLDRVKRPGLRTYCAADHSPEHVREGMVLFNRPDCVARSYWTNHPIEEREEVILLIGDGKIAGRLLERGLLINVLPWEHALEYHVFGDWEDFRRNHYELGKIVNIDDVRKGEDSVYFETQPWNASAQLLAKADRILFCGDDEKENLNQMAKMRQYFPTKAQVDVYATLSDERCRSFGGDDALLSREVIMQEKLNKMAIMLNDLYCQKTGGGSTWAQLSEFHRQSNIAAADHLLTKVRLLLPQEHVEQVTPAVCGMAHAQYLALDQEHKEACRWLEHKRWARFHVLNNWSHATKRDNAMRRHNLLVPYEKLTEPERALDDSAWEILGEIK